MDGTESLPELAGPIAVAAARAGCQVELVGVIPDGAAGDAITVALGAVGVGHAALLRDPSGAARLDARDIELGLRYVPDYRVIVVASPLSGEAEAVVLDAATYQGAALVTLMVPGTPIGEALADAGTVLGAPAEPSTAFADMVGRYAAALDRGDTPAEAFASASRAAGWEPGGE